ncbi:hypothetical protein TWF106_006483 [Orbilia oligospora]|uniref:Uncharacterized protein n=1 Tax=Orbilia oligospora TaxID=2813651 RepID=A0A7C8UU74_ORBOL|nr:hypothetical protein TWF106_006483 [Orbilia oligospora]
MEPPVYRKSLYRYALINFLTKSDLTPSSLSSITKSDVLKFFEIIGLRTPGVIEAIWSHRNNIHNIVEMWVFFRDQISGFPRWDCCCSSPKKCYGRALRRLGLYGSTINRFLDLFQGTKMFQPTQIAIEYAQIRFSEALISQLDMRIPRPPFVKVNYHRNEYLFICGSALNLRTCLSTGNLRMLAQAPPSLLSQDKEVVYAIISEEDARKRLFWLRHVYQPICFDVSVFYLSHNTFRAKSIRKTFDGTMVGFIGEKSWRYLSLSFCGILDL